MGIVLTILFILGVILLSSGAILGFLEITSALNNNDITDF